MEWSASTVVTSYVTVQKSAVPFDYVFKLNTVAIPRKEGARILETGNGVVRGHTCFGYPASNQNRHAEPPSARIAPPLCFGTSSLETDISRPHTTVTAQTRLDCAREVLDRKRRLVEKSQDQDDRMGRKRKINDEGVEIRKSVDRPTKRQCDEKTRNIGFLSDVTMEVVACEIDSRKPPQAPSILTSHKRLLPLFQSLIEATSLYDYKQVHNKGTVKGAPSPRKSRLSECYTAHS